MSAQPPAPRRSVANRLGQETSPYLQQHAHNPVDWFPWGNEALTLARDLDKPIFLSIGYSACHWCHVMEHESFENPEIADLMNRHFINIKVDREERPDLDQIYMAAVQLMTRRGGWPMSVFLTPKLKPFYGGTYWPPVASRGMPGFRDILHGVHDAWTNRRAEVSENAERLTTAIVEDSIPQPDDTPLKPDLIHHAATVACQRADRRYGGFGPAPKFPHSMDLRVLLRAWKRFGDTDALEVVKLTLDQMAAGGIYDQLGGGFHRYSTDERWLAPHFEKMLYDNALLVPVYLEAWQATGNADYLRVVRETLDYVLREMTHPEGGFYSTQDADSEGVEGKFFVWTEAEILQLLGPDDGRVFDVCYDVTVHGNWEETNILNRPKPHAEAAKELGLSEFDLSVRLQNCREKLFAVRSKRIWPGRDEKILAGWNGLMFSAMAQAAQVLDEPKYAVGAERAADFVLSQLQPKPGRLLHVYKDGQAKFNAFSDDYACVIDGLVDVFQATQNVRHLKSALKFAETLRSLFEDVKDGGFFFTSHDHEELIARQKDLQDNATPSGNSMAATALLRLGRLTSRQDLEKTAERTLQLSSSLAKRYPNAAGQMLLALDFWLGPTYEVAIIEGSKPPQAAGSSATSPPPTQLADLLKAVHQKFVPNKVLAIRHASTTDANLPAELSVLKGKPARGGQATAYICQHGTCGMPQTDPVAVQDFLCKTLDRRGHN
ncbi:MAG: hypothetical protein JWM11_4195 [Planctomycetaceae bacterium]|nr:hypothetical protein [Planctomycetaceae bacterium]